MFGLRQDPKFPEQPTRAVYIVIGVALLLLVAFLDYITGPELDFSLFYLLPVCFLAWHGASTGYAASILSVATWQTVDRLTGAKTADPLLIVWNMVLRLLFFSGSVILVNYWKNAGRMLSLLVDERTSALRNLAVQLSTTEDAERRKLAYDIHDTLSQQLSLIKMNLDSAHLDCVVGTPQYDRLADCGTMVDGVIKQTKTLMFDLHPAMLDDLGLVPTLLWYAAEFERRTGAELLVSQQGQPITLPVATVNYLFRTAKELLSNAVRHGRAKEIIVTLHWEPARVRLVVDDDGVGFDATNRSPGGLGLTGIEERIGSMGGSLLIESTRGQGTRVIIEVPAPIDLQEARHAATSIAG